MEASYGLSVPRDLWTATGLPWAEGEGIAERDSIAEGGNAVVCGGG